MSGEAVRDVTVRVSVQGGKIDKLPDFEKLTSAADAFYRTVDSGMKILRSDAIEASTATQKLLEDMKAVAGVDLGDLGLGEARAAVQEIATAVQEMSGLEQLNVSFGGQDQLKEVSAAVEQVEEQVVSARSAIDAAAQATGRLNSEIGSIPDVQIRASELGEVKSAIDGVVESVREIGNLGGIDLGVADPGQVDEVSTSIERLNEEISQTIQGLEESWAASDELAAAGKKIEDDLATSLASAATEAENLAQAELDAKYDVEEATKSATESIKQEGKSAAEVAFKKIALQERLAAHHRRTSEEVLKEEKKKQEAYKKSGDEQRQHMLAASGAIAQALAAGTQFVSTIQLIAGESPEIEELAKQFAKVQGIVQGIAAGTQAFNSLNQGLTSLQAASAAATAQLTATGGAATFTQGALIRLAPAAAVAQAALGPVAIAIAGISLAVTAVSAISAYFSDELPNDAEESTRAFERMNDQLDKMKARIDRNAQSIQAQNQLLRAELDLRNAIDGTVSASDIQEQKGIEVQTATSEANSQLQAQRVAMQKQLADLKKKLAEQDAASIQIFHDTEGNDSAEANKRRNDIVADMIKTEEEINRVTKADYVAATELNMPLATDNIAEFAEAVKKLPKEQQAAYEKVLSEFANKMQTSLTSANQELTSSLQENTATMNENQRAQETATKAFEQEQNVALRLQAPEERAKLEQDINKATATGNLNAGIDALSGTVSSEREQELRNQLAEGNLTREKLLAEIADAAEFETEKAELEKQIATLKEQAEAIKATREELTKSQEQVRAEMKSLQEELRQTQQAQQAR